MSFTLLVVDDEKQNRALLAELLQDEHRVLLAKNGLQALERAREHLPDLILLDILMPEMDGFEVIRALKRDDALRNIPVIFISALDAAGDEEAGLELGAVDYISKPFHPSIVRARIRNHLLAVHQRRLLEQLALLDSLTEIPNRRRFNEVYEHEWRRCLREKQALSMMVIDVDSFKRFNDSQGHAAGDMVLKRVARAIQASLKRSADFVARYGGEEFVVLLPGVEAEGGAVLAEQIRQGVEAEQIPHACSEVGAWVTVSIGGATCEPTTGDIDADFFRRADSELYRAKATGRNRVCWHSERSAAETTAAG